MIDDKTLVEFDEKLYGDLIQPGDDSYDDARNVYNGMIDRKPGCIAYCKNVGDVMAAVNFGRENEIRTAIRGGGHNAAGLGVCDDGLVIDLSNIDFTHVDPEAKTVRVGGGATLSQLDHATHAFGLATPTGIMSTTGIGGLTLGGGLGYLTRKYGLTIDNLLEVDMVLADGSFMKASNTQNEDLFWAIRGGGGNFGVITSFEFQLHEVDTVYGGPMLWEMDQAKNIMQWYREFIVEAPKDIYGFFAFMTVKPTSPFPEHLHNKKMCGIVWCYTGPMDHAEEVFKPIRNIGDIALDMAAPLPYPVLQSLFDKICPPGLQWYWKSDFVTELSNEAIQKNIEHASKMPTLLSSMHMYPVNGAVHNVDKEDTAYNYRDANWALNIAGIDPDPANREKISRWATEYWKEAVHPFSSGGGYVNFMMGEGEDRIKATYRNNYDRLAKIKAKYDPDNFFNVNQNIKPA